MIKNIETSSKKLTLLLVLIGILAGAVYWAFYQDLSLAGGLAQADESVMDLFRKKSLEAEEEVNGEEVSPTSEEELSGEDTEVELIAIDPDGRLRQALDEIAETKAKRTRPKKSLAVEIESPPRLLADAILPAHERGTLFKSHPGLLFIYRLKWDGISSRKIPVFLNGKPLVELEHGKFLALPCSLETQEIFSEMERQRVSVRVSHGETYCLNVFTGMLGKGGVRFIPLNECQKQIEGLAPQFALEPIPIRFE